MAIENSNNVLKYVKEVGFPANKGKIVSIAERNHAPKEVIDLLNELGDDNFSQESLTNKIDELLQGKDEDK
jgi:hypothetical protein